MPKLSALLPKGCKLSIRFVRSSAAILRELGDKKGDRNQQDHVHISAFVQQKCLDQPNREYDCADQTEHYGLVRVKDSR